MADRSVEDGPVRQEFECALCGGTVPEVWPEWPRGEGEAERRFSGERVCKECIAAGRDALLMLQNRAMARKLARVEAFDLSQCERTEFGEYVSPPEMWTRNDGANADLCDAQGESWIGSVARADDTGRILAATDSRFYQAEGWRCLWLR
jgi:hypothetical protein